MLKIYNTLSRKKEVFRPKNKKSVNLFVCGPTVYDFSHLGHARTYIAFDVIVKYLRQSEYDVFYLQNITDIDDKIIARAAESKTTPLSLARNFEKEYLEDMKTLGIDSVTKYARATEHTEEIISQVERLLKKGFAYRIADGIYYDISKFKNYGKLSKRTVLGAENAVSRIDESKDKRNKGDFCLWKFSKPDEPKWQSPWGEGRPGWHIEDTAITEKYFGNQYDMHGGARDLIFPHHEAEISQMEAISEKSPLVKYWIHTGFLTVKSEKMSKSLGNFITIRNFFKNGTPRIQKSNSARILRAFFFKSHYRSPIDYNEKSIQQTKKELKRIDDFINKLETPQLLRDKQNAKLKNTSRAENLVSETEKNFNAAMEDDFNTPKAFASVFNLISEGNVLIAEKDLTKGEAERNLNFLKKIDEFLNFIFPEKTRENIPQELLSLAKVRELHRIEKNWRKSDEIRKEIESKGYRIEDTKQGPQIRKI